MSIGRFLWWKTFEESQSTEKSVRCVSVSVGAGQEGRQNKGKKLRHCVYMYIRGINHQQSKEKLKQRF